MKILISYEHDGATTTGQFSAENSYATEAEVDLHGITCGQRLIDGKVPGLLVNYKSSCHWEVGEPV